MRLELNFIGICVANWHAAYDFYSETAGMHTELEPAFGDWACLGGGWPAYQAGSKSMIVELFDQGRVADGGRAWGRGQGIRPAIHVADLEAVVATARARGLSFTSEVETTNWGRRIEFSAPEDTRWVICQAQDGPSSHDLSIPYVGHVELKAFDLAGQRAFYRDLMGMQVEYKNEGLVILGQGAGKPWLTLEAGGEAQRNDPAWAQKPERGHPIFLSFMTDDIYGVTAQLREAKCAILKDVVVHTSWGGTDIIVADADGNVLEIVQYANLPT